MIPARSTCLAAALAALALVGGCKRGKLGRSCDAAKLGALTKQLDAAEPHARPDLVHAELAQACSLSDWMRTYLDYLAPVGTEVPRRDERSRALLFNHQAFADACAIGMDIFDGWGDRSGAERYDHAYERCELERFEFAEPEDKVPLMVWAVHAWLLDHGVDEGQARTLTQAVLLSDRRAFAPAGTYADRRLPELGTAAPEAARGLGFAVVHITQRALIYEDETILPVEDGRIRQARELPQLDGHLGYAHDTLEAMGSNYAGGYPTQLSLAADVDTRLATIAAVVETGTKAGFAEFGLVVEPAAFEQLALVFERANPRSEPEYVIELGRTADELCEDEPEPIEIGVVAPRSATVAELASQLAALWAEPCVARVFVRFDYD